MSGRTNKKIDFLPETKTILGVNAGLLQEPCEKTEYEQQAEQPGDWMTNNPFIPCEDFRRIQNYASLERGNILKDGFEVPHCFINKESDIQLNKKQLTNPNYIHQLFTRPYLGAYFGKGWEDVPTSSVLRSGLPSREKKACNVMAGATIESDRLEYCLYDQVQKYGMGTENVNILPRGGADTRMAHRRINYSQKCKPLKPMM